MTSFRDTLLGVVCVFFPFQDLSCAAWLGVGRGEGMTHVRGDACKCSDALVFFEAESKPKPDWHGYCPRCWPFRRYPSRPHPRLRLSGQSGHSSRSSSRSSGSSPRLRRLRVVPHPRATRQLPSRVVDVKCASHGDRELDGDSDYTGARRRRPRCGCLWM